MQLFVLHHSPRVTAYLLPDKTLPKLVLEAAQIASSACHVRGMQGPYKKTHARHPWVVYAAQSEEQFLWVCGMGLALAHEYTRRYGRVHKSRAVLLHLRRNTPFDGTTPPDPEALEYATSADAGTVLGRLRDGRRVPLVMPDTYHRKSAYASYRAYLRHEKLIKNARMCRWYRRPDSVALICCHAAMRRRKKMARRRLRNLHLPPAGLEPATTRLKGERSTD